MAESAFTVRTNAKEIEGWIARMGRQAPFVASRTLNTLAKSVRAAEIDAMRGAFTVRRASFLSYATRMEFSTRGTQTARVYLAPERDRGILSKHGEDGTKRPSTGTNLAIPVAARPSIRSLIPRRLRLANLGTFGKANPLKVFKAGPNIFQRQARRGLRLLYTLRSAVPIKRRLFWVEVADRVVAREFRAAALEAIDRAIRTAK